DVALSDPRDIHLDFHETPALHSWSQVYQNPGQNIQSLLDFEGKNIVVLDQSIQQSYLDSALKGFGVNAKLTPVTQYEDGFKLVEAGLADAVVSNHHFGNYTTNIFNVEETPIIFLPNGLYFATAENENPALLATIDQQLQAWQADTQSFYYDTLRKWGGEPIISEVPRYIWWALITSLILLGVTLLASSHLRREVKRRKQRLAESESLRNIILDAVDACIYIKDSQLHYLYVNEAAAKLFNRPATDIIGKKDEDLFDLDTVRKLNQIDRLVMTKGERFAGEEIDTTRNDNKTTYFYSVKIPLRNTKNEINGLCGISTDITEQRNFRETIEKLSRYDALTALPNRSYFFEQLETRLKNNTTRLVNAALIIINIDDFRLLNDTQGHRVGDLLLAAFAKTISNLCQPEDLVARLVGDSFVVYLDELPTLYAQANKQVLGLADKLRKQLGRPYRLEQLNYQGSVSIGATVFNGHNTNAQEALKQAELALYQAKAAGRGSMRIFEPEMEAIATARSEMERGLRQAIERDEFILHYQPQIDNDQGIVGVEALVRWQHPQQGLTSPASFIPLAELTGLIIPLGKKVLQMACTQLAEWQTHAATQHLTVAVNVSAKEFFDDGFVDYVSRTLEETGAPPAHLELELTESQLMQDVNAAITKMHTLRQKGIRLSLDDFGTGYSSLSQIQQLPVDQLKIDAVFVRDLVFNRNDIAIVQTIISLGKALNLEVIAEGIETQAQRDVLARLGCHKYQGFFYGKPQPAALLTKKLTQV
ncbi:MAG: diguanylate cyclase, partial [Pusillimonas sp.]|nr:diguanylate cyclase [Pusillimonas sp.]